MVAEADIRELPPSRPADGPQVRSMRRYATSPWTQARIELVKVRWSQGVSAQRIARELGDDITRSAVIGKVHRLGIVQTSPNSGSRRSESRSVRRAARRRHDVLSGGAGSGRERPTWACDAEPYVDDPRADADIPVAQRRAFLELSSRACRWPVGDPGRCDFFFCGAEAFPGKPYCVAHCARAYQPEDETTGREPAASSRARALRHRDFDQARRSHRRKSLDREER